VAIIVVGGAYKGAGKTSLICGIIAAFPRLRWTAVKITSDIHHLGAAERLSGTSPLSIWEQTAAGQGTDTARYLAARAHRGIFVTAPESDIPIAEIQGAIGSDSGTANVIFESNRIIRALKPDLCVAIIGDAQRAAKPSFQAFAEHADAFVTTDVASEIADGGNPLAPIFYLDSLERISGEMFAWMQARLRLTQTS
jgi:hypothetical protein